MKRVIAVFLMSMPGILFAQPSMEDVQLLQDWVDSEATCSGRDATALTAPKSCAKNQSISEELERRGWCYGPVTTHGVTEIGWQPCSKKTKAQTSEAVIVFPMGNIYNKVNPGDVIRHDQALTILYPNRPCELNTAYASNMHGAEQYLGHGLHPACWGVLMGPTSDEIMVMDMYGNTSHGNLISFFKADLNADGSMRLGDKAVSIEQHNREMLNAARTLQQKP